MLEDVAIYISGVRLFIVTVENASHFLIECANVCLLLLVCCSL